MNPGQKLIRQITKDTARKGNISSFRKCRISVRAQFKKDDLRTVQHYKNLNK